MDSDYPTCSQLEFAAPSTRSGLRSTIPDPQGDVEKCREKDSDQYAEKLLPVAPYSWADRSTSCSFADDWNDHTIVSGACGSRRMNDFDFVPERNATDDELAFGAYNIRRTNDFDCVPQEDVTDDELIFGACSSRRTNLSDYVPEEAMTENALRSDASCTPPRYQHVTFVDSAHVDTPAEKIIRERLKQIRYPLFVRNTFLDDAKESAAGIRRVNSAPTFPLSIPCSKTLAPGCLDQFDVTAPSPALFRQFYCCDEVEPFVEKRFASECLGTKSAPVTTHHPGFEDRLSRTASDLNFKECQGERERQEEEGARRASWSLGTALHSAGTCTPCRF